MLNLKNTLLISLLVLSTAQISYSDNEASSQVSGGYKTKYGNRWFEQTEKDIEILNKRQHEIKGKFNKLGQELNTLKAKHQKVLEEDEELVQALEKVQKPLSHNESVKYKKKSQKNKDKINQMEQEIREKELKMEQYKKEREEVQKQYEEISKYHRQKIRDTGNIIRKAQTKINQAQTNINHLITDDATQIINSIYDVGQMISFNNNYKKFTLSPTLAISWYQNTSSNSIESTATSFQIPAYFNLDNFKLSIAYIYNDIDGNIDSKTFKQNAHTGMLHLQIPRLLGNTAGYVFISYTDGNKEIDASKNDENQNSNELANIKSSSSDVKMLLGGIGINELFNTSDKLSVLLDASAQGYLLNETNKSSESKNPEEYEAVSFIASISANYKVSEIFYISPFISAGAHFHNYKILQSNKNNTTPKYTSAHFKCGISATANFNSMYLNLKGYEYYKNETQSIQSIAVTLGGAL